MIKVDLKFHLIDFDHLKSARSLVSKVFEIQVIGFDVYDSREGDKFEKQGNDRLEWIDMFGMTSWTMIPVVLLLGWIERKV